MLPKARLLGTALAAALLLHGATPAAASYFDPVKKLGKKMEKKFRESDQVESPDPAASPGLQNIPPGAPVPTGPRPTGQQPVAPGTKKPGPTKAGPTRPGPGRPTARQSPAPARRTPLRGLLRVAQGTVKFKSKLSANWQPILAGVPLEDGDSLQTGAPGSAIEIEFGDGSVVRLDQFTVVALRDGARRGMQMFMGRLTAKLGSGTFAVMSPTATISGAGVETDVFMDGDDTIVSVNRGQATVRGATGAPVAVSGGQFTSVPPKRAAAVPLDQARLQERLAGSGPALAPKVVLVDRTPDEVLRGTYAVEVNGLMRPVEYVEFLVDGNVEFVANVPPFRYNLDTRTMANGKHMLTAIVHWAQHARPYTTDKLDVEVGNEPTPAPSVVASPAASPAAP